MSFAEQQKTRKQRQGASSFIDPGTIQHQNLYGSLSQAHITTEAGHTGDAIKGEIYPELPPFLEIRTYDTSGRGIWTKTVGDGDSKNIPAGTRLFAVQPHVSTLSTIHLSSLCSACHRSAGPAEAALQRCVKCKIVWYCSKKCQTSDWQAHKHECASLQYWMTSSTHATVPILAPKNDDAGASIPGEAIRCLGRLLWLKEKNKGRRWAKELDLMQSHRSVLQESAQQPMTMLAHAFARYITASDTPSPETLNKWGVGSARDLLDIISRFTVNAFTLTNPPLTAVGVAVSPLAALINHSCIPNAVVVFPRSSRVFEAGSDPLEVVAIRDLRPGEEVLTSYVDISLPRRLRLKELKDRYMFDCVCGACDTPTGVERVDPREAMICGQSSCTSMLALPDSKRSVASICPSCKNFPTVEVDAVLDAVRLGEEALEKATAMELDDPEGAMRYTSNLIPLLSRHVPITSHPLLALYRLHQTLLIGQISHEVQLISNLSAGSSAHSSAHASESNPRLPKERVDQVCTIAARSLSAILVVFPAGHPVRGIALAELGKLLCVDVDENAKGLKDLTGGGDDITAQGVKDSFPAGEERLKLSRDTFLRARAELRLGFGGDGGEVARQVEESIRNIEKEWQGWRRVVSQNGVGK
ncbi:hypothetical protein FRB94_010836 [Tulasnella sp. JGI-2019a]|nr:hypothetical protein FRB94_010836 [Tulasnella sp. JGI-2019a]